MYYKHSQFGDTALVASELLSALLSSFISLIRNFLL
jgi:hypothetical protein